MQQLKITKSITNRESQTFVAYLREISKQPMLSAEEEAELACKIRTGNKAALNRLVNANLRFVVSVAKQFHGSGLPLPDLVNEGNMGLLHATKRFDETKGFKFISYAVWWIRQRIMKAIAEQRHIVRFPISRLGLNAKIEKQKCLWRQTHEREPDIEELSEILHTGIHEIMEASSMNIKHVSLDAPVSSDGDYTFGDTVACGNADEPDNLLNRQSLEQTINNTLDKSLTGQQKKIVCWYFGIGVDQPRTLEDIGNLCNISRERARQIKEKAISQLQSQKNCNGLRIFLG